MSALDEANTNARAPLEGEQNPGTISTEPAPHSVGAAPHRKLKADLIVIGSHCVGSTISSRNSSNAALLPNCSPWVVLLDCQRRKMASAI